MSLRVNKRVLFVLSFLLSGCFANHSHDGLYIANRSTSGVANAWIVKGNELTVYSLGVVTVKRCRQYADHLIIDDDTFMFNEQGDIILKSNPAKNMELQMARISDRTDYTVSELNKLVDEVYDREGSFSKGKRGQDSN